MEISLNSSSNETTLLADDCWEFIFKIIISDDSCYFKSLSLVSKQFLSITNRLLFSLTISTLTPQPLLPSLFQRFTYLTSLNLTRFHGDLNKLLCQISCFPLNITSLNLSAKFTKSTIPFVGLLSFSKKITTLTSLTYSNIYSIHYTDFIFIADCFPLLEELYLINNLCGSYDNFEVDFSDSFTLYKLRKVRLKRQSINDELLFHLFKNCKHLEEAVILGCDGITDDGIASAISQRPTLKSLSLSDTFGLFSNITTHFIDSLVSLPLTKLILINCCKYSYAGIICLLSKCRQSLQHLNLLNADFLSDQHVVEFSLLLRNLVFINLIGCKMLTESALFALVRNCASLSEIKIEIIWRKSVQNPDSLMGFGVYPQLKSLYFAKSVENPDSLLDFGVYPQLKYLYFANNRWLSDESIIKFASIFHNLQVLDLSNCVRISDEISKLEVLNLSETEVDDETLNVISRNCCGLLQLKLNFCNNITEKGVNRVIENCTQLRKISLQFCDKVHNNVVDSMLNSRPSLRKIIAPHGLDLCDKKKKLFLSQGCILK
ncbi:hypothetical protein TSUD_259080 [Trifolium subterraneum]|uniref:F-box/LRR-repeat protein 15-like leucin rich repeat domain-containing protein n=1 Tax=Trifolium subterraneum TaxID=3900 RepID=A0A2Z6MQV1_TRISU|nr:hypothetical protein TSUD_259080 [Trifolium subterraneum]